MKHRGLSLSPVGAGSISLIRDFRSRPRGPHSSNAEKVMPNQVYGITDQLACLGVRGLEVGNDQGGGNGWVTGL